MKRSFKYQTRIVIAIQVCLLSILPAEAKKKATTMQDSEHTAYYKKPAKQVKQKKRIARLLEPQYDFRDLGKSITKGCKTDFQKIKAIYQWICNNIDYDTTYRIYTADSCIKARKGVCQAYCDLFMRIAATQKIKVETIYGKTKNPDGSASQMDHTWLFAYTSKNYGIFLDPTWGAGTLEKGKFRRSDDCWFWFNVEPEKMALTHFPKEASYQLVNDPLSMTEFTAMPSINMNWLKYGLTIHELYTKARTPKCTLPVLFTRGEGIIQFVDIPFQSSLKIGQFYTFRIKLEKDIDFSFIAGNHVFDTKKQWKDEGNGIYSIAFMPRSTEDLCFCLKSQDDDQEWNNILRYHIDTPTKADWSAAEPYYPLAMPEVQHAGNLEPEEWAQAGIDNHQLLKLIKENNVQELPLIYSDNGQKLTIVEVPMTKVISRDHAYTFRFYPKSGVKWAIKNESAWLTDWEVSDDGMYTMTITPTEAGHLTLNVQIEEGQPYWAVLKYDINK